MFGFDRLFSRRQRKGDGATYGIDYTIGMSYKTKKRDYLQAMSFKPDYFDLLTLFEDYSWFKEGPRPIKDVELLVEPVSEGFDLPLLRRKVDSAVGKIMRDREKNRVKLELFKESPLMYDSPELTECMAMEVNYSNAIKGAGLLYSWMKRHEESGDALKA